MKIFALDCSSVSAGVAILEDDKVLGESFVNVKLTHSQTLMPMVEELFKNTKIAMQDIDFFALTHGPGSFTGVRIGVAAIKGMADALQKPCYTVSALEAAAYPFQDFNGIVCALMDARRDQAYTALFENGKRLTEDSAWSLDELLAHLYEYPKKEILLVGDGTEKGYAFLQEKSIQAVSAMSQFRFVHASSVAFLAKEQIQNGIAGTKAKDILPLYLRLPQAQRELNNKNQMHKGE